MQYCPHPELQRSRRRWYEWLPSLLLRLRPHRCALCHQRVWRYAGVWYRDLAVVSLLLVVAWYWHKGTEPKPDPLLQMRVGPTSAPTAPLATLVAAPEQPSQRATASATAAPVTQAAPTPTPTPTPKAKPKPSIEPAQAPPAGLRLDKVETQSAPGKFVLRLAYTGATVLPRLYRLQAPPRMVLDLPGEWSVRQGQLQALSGDGVLVRQARFGKHANSMRVVIDLAVDSDTVKPNVIQRDTYLQLTLTR